MSEIPELRDREQLILLAILRQFPNAYGVSIREEIKSRAGKDYSYGSIYAVLEKLEDAGFVEAREGEPTPSRGGRRKQYFTITGRGKKALQASLHALDSLRLGVDMGEALA